MEMQDDWGIDAILHLERRQVFIGRFFFEQQESD